jgi:hypothetical protein
MNKQRILLRKAGWMVRLKRINQKQIQYPWMNPFCKLEQNGWILLRKTEKRMERSQLKRMDPKNGSMSKRMDPFWEK